MIEKEPGTELSFEVGDRASAPHRKRQKRAGPIEPARSFTPGQRLLILDIWERSEAPAADFASLVGLSNHTLYAWRKRFQEQGPAGLMDQPKGAPRGSRLSEPTQRAILMLSR